MRVVAIGETLKERIGLASEPVPTPFTDARPTLTVGSTIMVGEPA